MRKTNGSFLPPVLMRMALVFCAAAAPAFVASCSPSLLPGNANGGNSNGSGSGDGSSVGGVVVGDDIFGPPGGDSGSTDSLRARIRNESASRADVTIRFIDNDAIVHLAFVRSMPETVTTVTSPDMATQIEISGIDAAGRALGDSLFRLGVDYDKFRPAEYVISAAPGDGGPVDPIPDDDEPVRPLPVSISLIEPATDVEVEPGATVPVRWVDEGGGPGAVVRLFLSPVNRSSERIAAGPAVGAALDGLNDQLSIVVQGVEPETYLIVAEIADGFTTATAVAPGRVIVLPDSENVAPTISIVSPRQMVDVERNGLLNVEWSDDDPDDNATITFALESSEGVGVSTGRFSIGAAYAEDPDGAGFDRVALPLTGVLPGLYDLIATIDDGERIGTDRVAQAVRVRGAPVNDAPTLRLIEPAADIVVPLNGSFTVRWEDSDGDDNARISLFLDPDLSVSAINGNEFLLAASIGEDADGPGDMITLGIPAGVLAGMYRVVGVITDGQVEVTSAAPGRVTVTEVDPGRNPVDPRPQPLRSIQFASPTSDVRLRLGEAFPVRILYRNLPASVPPRLFVTGTNELGQTLRVEVTPPDATADAEFTVLLPGTPEVIPNKWWPRRFRLDAEATVDGTRYTASADGAVWIRQEVELLSIRMVNYWCFDEAIASPEASDFFGLDITWMGGGFESASGHPPAIAEVSAAPVRFWASFDGLVPDDLKGDRRHRMMWQVVESPNVVQTTRIDYATMIGLGTIAGTGDDPIPVVAALDSGLYRIVAAAETPSFGRLLTTWGPTVEVCFPLPVSRKPPAP
jgi:hypothetical protein